MITPSIYINLEDGVDQVAERIKREKAPEVVLVCPKRCFLFSDSNNLKLLKSKADILGKSVAILTMDERGQQYARAAGFELKFLPNTKSASGVSDIRAGKSAAAPTVASAVSSKPVSRSSVKIKKTTHNSEMPAKMAPSVTVEDRIFSSEPVPEPSNTYRKSSIPKFITGLVTVSLIIVLLVVFIILPKADVSVYAKTEPVTRDMEVTVSNQVKEADVAKLLLPSQSVDTTLEADDSFQSQGKKEVGNKATGTIRIYNFTKAPINLKAGTTTITAGSKVYFLTQDALSIRPAVYKDPLTKEVDPKSLPASVEVIAQDGGEGYNLPSGTRVEITNQVFGSKPQLLFAKIDSAITGGTTRFLSVVSDKDIQDARTSLNNKLIAQLRSQLQSQGLVVPESAYIVDSPVFTADKPAGTESPVFSASLKAHISGISFSEKDLLSLALDRIGQTISTNKTVVLGNPDQLNYKIKTADIPNKTALLTVHFQGKAIYNIDLTNISKDLVGKSQVQANELLRSRAEVDKIEMTLTPSWQKSFPWFANKINVKVVR